MYPLLQIAAHLALLAFAFSANFASAQAAIASGSVSIPGAEIKVSWNLIGDSDFRKEKVQSMLVKIFPVVNSSKNSAEENAGTSDYALEKFNARMPSHNHGMVTKPKISLKEDSGVDGKVYRIDGVMLHMPGDWVLEFDVSGKQVSVPVRID